MAPTRAAFSDDLLAPSRSRDDPRVERICSHVLGPNAGIMSARSPGAVTFHGIGARLLRDYAEQIGLDPGLPSNDREDSADLMNLVRAERINRPAHHRQPP